MRTFSFCLVGLLAMAPVVQGQLPYYEIDMATTEPVSLMCRPDGGGPAFTGARLANGSVTDATISVVLHDGWGSIVPGFPREDMWFVSSGDLLAPCVAGTIADHDTDAEGRTTWSNPPLLGGHSDAALGVTIRLVVNGDFYATPPITNLSLNSLDLNGDGLVNLVDVVFFTQDYHADSYRYRSDFHGDETLNLLDVVALAQGLGAVCP